MTVMTADDGISREMQAWNAKLQGAIVIEGYDLIGGKENEAKLDLLIGVPLLIHNAIFRRGDITPAGWAGPRDYVSCELEVRPDHAHKFPRATMVVNDGSTGIYRQVVAALVERGMVNVPENMPEEGEANSTRYDVSFTDTDNDHREFRDVKIYCPVGFRASDYKNPDGSDGRTWYLA
jgi:hypothetical protein